MTYTMEEMLPSFQDPVSTTRSLPVFLCPVLCHCFTLEGNGKYIYLDIAVKRCWQLHGNFAAFSQFLAAYCTLDFTMSPLAGKGTWCLLPTTPAMLATATKHFDKADNNATSGNRPYRTQLDHCNVSEKQGEISVVCVFGGGLVFWVYCLGREHTLYYW